MFYGIHFENLDAPIPVLLLEKKDAVPICFDLGVILGEITAATLHPFCYPPVPWTSSELGSLFPDPCAHGSANNLSERQRMAH